MSETSEVHKTVPINISVCGHRREIRVGKGVVRLLGDPPFVCLRVNKNRDSILMLPCDSKERLAFRVPNGLYGKDGRQFRISSTSFLEEIVAKNGLDFEKNYMIPGTYVEKENCVVFNVKDAFEHMEQRGDASEED